jgi:carboxylesterase
MDSPTTMDSALNDSGALVSLRTPEPTDAQKRQPVCVLVHGFSASSFEWQEFLSYAKNQVNERVLFSSVVLGGHGRDYNAFKDASYQDWIAPIIDEVTRLQRVGYTNISLFGISAGATGLLHSVLTDQIDGHAIRQLILMDPYIIPQDKSIFWNNIWIHQYQLSNSMAIYLIR